MDSYFYLEEKEVRKEVSKMSEDAMNYLIYLSENSPWKLSVEETVLGLQPIKIPFKRLAEKIQTSIQSRVIRKISMREVVVKVINGRTRKNVYIPNIEFSEMVRVEGGLRFLNVTVTQNEDIGNNSYYTVKEYRSNKENGNINYKKKEILDSNTNDYISNRKLIDKSFVPLQTNKTKGNTPKGKMFWYHGTKAKTILKAKDIDVEKCHKEGEFGQGSYYTNIKELAKEYALTVKEEQLPSSKVFQCNWFSEELDMLYQEMQKCEKSFIKNLHGKPRQDGVTPKIKVKVLPKIDREWVETVLRGWAGFRVEGVEMVIGPLASKYTNDLAQKSSSIIIERKGNVKDPIIGSIVDKLLKEAKPLNIGIVEPIQLCCYEQWVNDLFIEIDCKKPLDI